MSLRSLPVKYKNLTPEHDLFPAGRETANDKCGALRVERDHAVAECQAAVAERDALRAERDSAIGARQRLLREREALVAELVTLETWLEERDSAIQRLQERVSVLETDLSHAITARDLYQSRARRWFEAAVPKFALSGNKQIRPRQLPRASLRTWIRKLIQRLGRKSNGLVVVADRARAEAQWETAARFYRDALGLLPENWPIWVQFGHALKEAGCLEASEIAYRTALELEGDVADTHLSLGHTLKLQGRVADAAAAYLRALVLDPASQYPAVELAQLGFSPSELQITVPTAAPENPPCKG